MNYTLTEEKAKRQAKQLSAYLKSLGLNLSYGNALEAVAKMHDTKTWNHLSAAIEAAEKPVEALKPNITATPVAEPVLYYRRNDTAEQVVAHVVGAAYSLDRVEDDGFDAAQWLLRAPEEVILELARNDWTLEYHQNTLGLAKRVWGDLIEYTHEYVADHNANCDPEFWTLMGVTLDAQQAMCFLRAFRYSLFVQLALDISFQNKQGQETTSFYGHNQEFYQAIKRDHYLIGAEESVAEGWSYFCGSLQMKGQYGTAAKAWEALGPEVEALGILDWTDEVLKDAKNVKRESGFIQRGTVTSL